jgi:glycosyltransferase involved in cell wall biosynthesis
METILAQTVTDWELIISDNYSDDGSWEFFQQFKRDPRIRLSRAPRRGMYANWNECLHQAQGKYVYIATSDDTMLPSCLESLVRPLEHLRNLDIAVCDYQEIDQNGSPLAIGRGQKEEFLREYRQHACIWSRESEFLTHATFGTMWMTMTSVLFRRKLIQSSGLFRTDIGSIADEEWTLRASLASDVAYVPGRFATWRLHPGQATSGWDPQRKEAILLQCLRRVLTECFTLIPAKWKLVPHWRKEIAAAREWYYHSNLRLGRWVLRCTPSRFLHDAANCLRYDPSWLVHHAKHGFTLTAPPPFDAVSHVKRLMKLFECPWPPQKVEPGW